jgi:type II secretory pathway component PulM
LQNSASFSRSFCGIGPVGPADQHVGRDADGAQLLHRMLRRLGLQLARCRDVGQQRQVHEDALAARLVLRELADRLEERQALDVADRAADLAEHEVDLVLADAHEVLDLVGDVRDHLDGLAPR